MAQRGLYHFITPEEFEPLCWEVAQRLGLWVVKENWYSVPGQRVKRARLEWSRVPGPLTMADGRLPYFVYFAETEPDLGVALDELETFAGTGITGWVQIEYPRVVEKHPKDGDKYLERTDLGTKSDCFDREKCETFHNPAAIDLWGRIAKLWRKRLHRPMWRYGYEKDGSRAWSADHKTGYTDGVAAWFTNGWKLGNPAATYYVSRLETVPLTATVEKAVQPVAGNRESKNRCSGGATKKTDPIGPKRRKSLGIPGPGKKQGV